MNDIRVDRVNNKLYWTTGTNAGGGNLRRSNLDGTSVETLITGLNWVSAVGLDTANSQAYYIVTSSSTPANSSINRINFDGSGNTNLITGGVASGARELALVPEPSTYALIFGGAAVVLVLLRRRFLSC